MRQENSLVTHSKCEEGKSVWAQVQAMKTVDVLFWLLLSSQGNEEVRTGMFSELREGEGMEYHIPSVLRSTVPPHLTISKIGMGLTFHGMLQYNRQ